MSQQHPRRRRRVGRRVAALLAPALVGGLLVASGAASARPAATAGTPYTSGTYFVQLAGQPLAAYSKTAAKAGTRLNTRTETARDYIDHLTRKRDKVLDAVAGVRPLHNYDLLLNGFAAKLTAAQADELARTPGVVALTRNTVRHPVDEPMATSGSANTMATTAVSGAKTAASAASGTLPAPDTAKFLGLKKPGGLYSKIPGGQKNAGAGMILGDVDSGIYPGNPSLKPFRGTPPGQALVDKKWKGSCDPGDDPGHKVICNNKLIGAQYFNKAVRNVGGDDQPSAWGKLGHGTHTATIAAGDADVPAAVTNTGIAHTRISGIAPAARVAAYRVCWSTGCWDVDIIAALEKAVADGVDVINYSLGDSELDPANTPLFLAMANAAKAGVFISVSAGNGGPSTAINGVPWVTTVAASTHDLAYRGTVSLGNGRKYTGVSVNGTRVPSAPLVDAAKAAGGVDPADAALCNPGTLDPAKVKGTIVLCADGDGSIGDPSARVKAAGGVGMVLYNPKTTDNEFAEPFTVPTVNLDKASGQAVKAYADSGGTAELGAAFTERQQTRVAGFSSGGPDYNSKGDTLKPDITAPGVDVVAGDNPERGVPGDQNIRTGTSMSAPHVAGLALLLRQLHPDWSPMEVKSALMTTGTTKDNDGKPIQRFGGTTATPLDFGAGHVVPNIAADPGLVYDSKFGDWMAYLCAIGQPPVTTAGSDPCATVRKTDPSDLNSPSIAVGDLAGQQTVTRTVTNVARTTGSYTPSLHTPPGYKATVSPGKLVVAPGASASYRVTFTRTHAAYGDWKFGDITWSDGHHKVRSPIALRSAPIAAPDEVARHGATSVTLTARAGWNGTLSATVNGLYAGTTKTGTLTGAEPDFDPSHLTAATVKTELTVPEGTDFARVAITSADQIAGSDLDLWVYDKDGNLLWEPIAGNDEHIDLKPGTYEVYVNQVVLPRGLSSQKYTLHTWLIGKDTKPNRPATVTPAEQRVTMGETAKTTVSWRNLQVGQIYLARIEYSNGTDTVGTTILAVTP
ncbi:S8 family serine peptidase [Streptomyces griseorubiginosus]|uniref:S8 family serine peptidase n=1 Tax=Streptomyces griseorubiginosus TaxID=67304 RepID=UPI00244E25FC|nr:S8 family serine peptidase [Streptomyces griseorubiginosus]MBO4258130.1 S8 family serine peptidase [Streptomyces griseorubiginosus]